MSLTIALDPPDAVYSAGQKFRGYLILNSSQVDTNKTSVSIDFAGSCEVTLDRVAGGGGGSNIHAGHYHSKGYYFYEKAEFRVYDFYKCSNFQYKVPFTFEFPETAQIGVVKSPSGEGHSFTHQSPYQGSIKYNWGFHLLPPSFELRDVKYIRYYLEARFEPTNSSKETSHKNLKTICDVPFTQHYSGPNHGLDYPLRLSNTNRDLVLPSKDYEVRSFGLLSSALSHGPSLTEKLKSRFKPNSLPLAKFRIEVHLPERVCHNFTGILPFEFRVFRLDATQDPKCEYNNPLICLDKISVGRTKVGLYRSTYVRAQGQDSKEKTSFTLLDVESGGDVDVDYSQLPPYSDMGGIGKREVPLTDLNQWGKIRLPQGLSQTTNTYNFAICYSMWMTMTIKVAEETIHCEPLSGVPFRVLPTCQEEGSANAGY
ncbi:hypothetical protein MMC10_003506 [Thelotrema lepadinum]|nr:hypothetical protein [Thelotrema lepadinum]